MDILVRGNSLYVTVNGPTWSIAKQEAISLGGYLASITTEGEFDYLHQLGVKGWIGLSDPFNTGGVNPDGSRYGWGRDNFTWESGETYTFESWIKPIFNADGNYVHFWDGHAGSTVWVGVDEDLSSDSRATWWEGKGIAEVPLSLSIDISDAPTEGTGVFTTSINLSAGNETSENLAEGAKVFWSISGITADDLDSGSLEGSGVITNGKVDIDLSLIQDEDTGESLDISVFSDAQNTQQIGNTQSFEVMEDEVDLITGTLGLRGKVKLKKRGRVSFRLYGSEDIDVNAIDFDSILFGGDPEVLMADAPIADTYFQGAKRKKGKRSGSYIARVKDRNGDGFDDIIMKAYRRDLAGVMERGDTEIYAYGVMGDDSVLWSNTDTVFF